MYRTSANQQQSSLYSIKNPLTNKISLKQMRPIAISNQSSMFTANTNSNNLNNVKIRNNDGTNSRYRLVNNNTNYDNNRNAYDNSVNINSLTNFNANHTNPNQNNINTHNNCRNYQLGSYHSNQLTEKSTTCQSIYNSSHSNNKQSIKNLLVAARSRNHCSQNLISMTYQDIRISQTSQKNDNGFFKNFLCGNKQSIQQTGCTCGNGEKCPWMDHWISLSMKNFNYHNNNSSRTVLKQSQQQIMKDLKRTQPNSKMFQSQQYQHVLYECLMAYARIDPQIGYIQGMNIVCSVLIYHSLDVGQCVQVFRFLMQTCGFRQLYLNDFQFARSLTVNLTYALKYRCSDLYRHLIQKYSVNLGIFAIGWILPMLGNIVPLQQMHMVLNCFIQRSWQGILKIIIAFLLYVRPMLLQLHDQTELMQLLSIQGLKNRTIPWQQIIMSSYNLKITGLLSNQNKIN